jgi:WD40 repeat protein
MSHERVYKFGARSKEGPLHGHKTWSDLTICDAKASWVETEAAYANCRNQIRLLIQEHYILLLKRLSLLEEQKAEIQELNLVNMRDAEAQQIKTNKSEQGISNIANTLPFFQQKQQNFEKKQENVETGHSKCINALVELPDKRLASASHDGKIKLWDLESGQCTTTLEGHTEYVYSLTVFSDGRLVSHSHDGTLRFWDLQTGKSTITSIRGNILTPIAALKNELLATGRGNSEIQLWDVRTEKIVQKFQYEKTLLGGHGSTPYISYIHASSEKYLVGCNRKAVTLWNLETGQCEITISHDNAYYTPMCFSAPIILPDKQHLAVFVSQYGVGYGISVWDVTGKRGVRKFNLATSVNGNFLGAFSHEHRTYLVGAGHVGYSHQQLIEIWCVDSKECVKKIVIPDHPKIRCLTILTGQRFATGYSSGETRIWNAITGNCDIILQRNSEVDRDCVKELSTAKEYRPG